MTPVQDAWLSPDQAANEIGVHPDTVRKACRANGLKASKLGRLWRIRRSDLNQWVENGEQP